LVSERSGKRFFVKYFWGEVWIPVVLESGAKEYVCIVEKLEVSGGFL
jgi:hypothetical protein